MPLNAVLYGPISEGTVNGGSLRYQTGEEIRVGDAVTHLGHAGQIDFVADPSNPTSETDWFIEEFGGGAMVQDSEIGSVFISIECMEDSDELVFVARKGPDTP